jgi:hypothetical protein
MNKFRGRVEFGTVEECQNCEVEEKREGFYIRKVFNTREEMTR